MPSAHTRAGRHCQRRYASLAEAALADPQNTRISLDLAKLLVLLGPLHAGRRPAGVAARSARSCRNCASLLPTCPSCAARAKHRRPQKWNRPSPPIPITWRARYQLSAVQLVASNYDAAMQQLLEIARRDRGFRHDAGRAGLHAVFGLLGDDDERVLRYRALLQSGLH